MKISKVGNFCAIVLTLFFSVPAAFAVPFIELGPSDNFAMDQPRVAVEVYNSTGYSFGPELYNTFLLDTGANGIMAAGTATEDMTAYGYQTVATYEEQGIAGTSIYDVSALYNLNFAGTSGSPRTLPNVRLLSSTTADFGGFDGIVGMPGMVNRVTTMDLTAMPIEFQMGVEFPNTLPTAASPRYSIPLSLVEFPLTGQQNPNDPPPTYAPLPFLQAQLGNEGKKVTGSFLLDTGAQISMISTAVALALGLDKNNDGSLLDDAVDMIEVGGVGGTVEVPILPVDSIYLPTRENVDLKWTDLQVIVVDIDPSIQGIVGSDLLTSGWLEAIFGESGTGYIQNINLDFRDAANLTGTMFLDINPDLNHLIFPGDANKDGRVDVSDLGVLAANYGRTTDATWALGDFNGDGKVDVSDLGVLAANYGFVAGSTPSVPEPAMLTLLLPGILGLFRKGKT